MPCDPASPPPAPDDPDARLRRLVEAFGPAIRKPSAARRKADRSSRLSALVDDPLIDERELAPLLEDGARAFGGALAGFAPREKISAPHTGLGFTPAHLNYLNEFARWRRQSAFRKRVARGDSAPLLVAEGDSWFHFPFMLKDIVLQLSADHLVWTLAKAGDEIGLMVHETDGEADREYLAVLEQYRGQTKALLFSGGGNELIGQDKTGRSQLEGLLLPYEAGRPPEWYVDNPAFKQRLAAIKAAYRRLFADVDTHFPGLPVVFHGYDYPRPFPNGPRDRRKPRWCAKNAFLGRAFDALGFEVSPLRRAVVACVIDQLNAFQRSLAGGNVAGGLFPNAYHIDLRGLLGDEEWADEIHPTDGGYAKVAERFRLVLAQSRGSAPSASANTAGATSGSSI